MPGGRRSGIGTRIGHAIPPGVRYLFSEEGGTTGSRTRDVTIKALRAYERDRWRFSPRRLGPGVDRIPIDRPIFLIGTQGASETIIGRCLRRNRAVVSMSGNSDHWTGGDEMGTVRNRMRRLPESLWGSKHRTDLPHPLLGTDQPYACDALLPRYRRTGAAATGEGAAQLARLIREHLAVYAHDPSAARFIDKTHAYTVKVPLIAALLEGAGPIFVLVVRNPYETCRWAVARKRVLFKPDVPDATRLGIMSEHWANAYATALEDAPVARLALVRFEDFLAHPANVVEALCEATGLAFDQSMVPRPGQKRPFATLPDDRKWYPLYRSDWLQGMTRAERELIAARCEPLAAELGYHPRGASPMAAPVQLLDAAAAPAARQGAATAPAFPQVPATRR
jgi:hypothetical protein